MKQEYLQNDKNTQIASVHVLEKVCRVCFHHQWQNSYPVEENRTTCNMQEKSILFFASFTSSLRSDARSARKKDEAKPKAASSRLSSPCVCAILLFLLVNESPVSLLLLKLQNALPTRLLTQLFFRLQGKYLPLVQKWCSAAKAKEAKRWSESFLTRSPSYSFLHPFPTDSTWNLVKTVFPSPLWSWLIASSSSLE